MYSVLKEKIIFLSCEWYKFVFCIFYFFAYLDEHPMPVYSLTIELVATLHQAFYLCDNTVNHCLYCGFKKKGATKKSSFWIKIVFPGVWIFRLKTFMFVIGYSIVPLLMLYKK